MATLRIRGVSERVHDALADRARQNGKSLQVFLLALLEREASFHKNRRLLEELDDWTTGSEVTAEAAVAALDAARDTPGRAWLNHPDGRHR